MIQRYKKFKFLLGLLDLKAILISLFDRLLTKTNGVANNLSYFSLRNFNKKDIFQYFKHFFFKFNSLVSSFYLWNIHFSSITLILEIFFRKKHLSPEN